MFFSDDKEPLARARRYIEEKRPSPDRVKPTGELNIIIKAMLMAEEGVATVNQKREKELINAIKHPANPEYPTSSRVFEDAAE